MLTIVDQASQYAALISCPGEALNVFDVEPVARARIPVAHWGYLMRGTVPYNRGPFRREVIR